MTRYQPKRYLIALQNHHGVCADILSYGATLAHFVLPDGTNIVLSLPTPQAYAQARNYLGGTVGRVIGRIAQGHWESGSRRYQFVQNDGPNHAHGGLIGLDMRDFALTPLPRQNAVALTYLDPAETNGYPGNLRVKVTYRLDERDTLHYQVVASSDALTLCDIANHTYFNLAGEGDVLAQRLQLAADTVLPLDAASIPCGRLSVAGSCFDFRTGRLLGSTVRSRDPQIVAQRGLNHPFLLCYDEIAAQLSSPQRRLIMMTDAPAIVVYTGNHFDHSGVAANLGQYVGVALEAQVPPTADPTLPGWCWLLASALRVR